MYTHTGAPLYLAADRATVVPEGDPRAAFLLIATGGQMPDDEAKRYGLDTAYEKADKDEKQKPAPANKLKTPTENKGR